MRDQLQSLPDRPGVYQYLDAQGRLLYVGKAKSLKKRVRSYWRFTPELHPNPSLGARLLKMLHEATRIDYLLAPSEADALILENALIKQLKPRYNILLRDDKTYPYIYLDRSEAFPRFELTRRVVQKRGVRYYGPFPSGGRALLDALYDLFPLVQKKSGLHGGKACLFHQIGKCLAPCEGAVSSAEYHAMVDRAEKALLERTQLLHAVEEQMHRLAEQERFEEAARLRDRLDAIRAIQIVSETDLATTEDLDVLAILQTPERGIVMRLFVRHGRIISASHTLFRQPDSDQLAAAYTQALLDFYTPDLPMTPPRVLLADPLPPLELEQITQTLRKRLGRAIGLHHPRRGPKKRLIEIARTNARALLERAKPAGEPIEVRLQDLLQLSRTPWRVEAFDNSHMMGQAPVGSMVVWDEGSWRKMHYRRYTLTARDEYGQMREMLTRRIKRFAEDPPPDLWLIDGGETLRRLAVELLREAGVHLDVVAIAKEKRDAKAHRARGAARDLLHADAGAFSLAWDDPRLQWCQRLRDEAHRFALAFHQQTKRRQDACIALYEKQGVGPATVKKLLDFFGTFEAIGAADLETLTALVGKKMALRVQKSSI